jgi:hypothetical protein
LVGYPKHLHEALMADGLTGYECVHLKQSPERTLHSQKMRGELVLLCGPCSKDVENGAALERLADEK